MELFGHQFSRLLAGSASLLFLYLYYKVSVALKLRRFKGPWGTSFSEIPHTRAFLTEECYRWYEGVLQKYGPIARISPRILITSSPDLWAHVNVKAGYKRSKWFYRPARFDWRRDNTFTEIDINKHDLRRRQMNPGYGGKENLTLEGDIDTCIGQFVNLIRTRYAGGIGKKPKAMDLARKVQFLTLDVITLLGFGRALGLLEADADPDDYLESTEDGLRAINMQMALGTWWINWIPWVGPDMNRRPEDPSLHGFDKMLAQCRVIADTRERAFHAQKADGVAEAGRADMLTSFMRHGLLGDDLKSEVVLQIVAGSDTTAGTLRGVMLQLLTSPRVYRKLVAEVDDAVARGIAPPTASGDIISYAAAQRLVYLQAVVRESIRAFPPLNNPLPRDTPPGGDTVMVDGEEVFLPGGVSIAISMAAMHKSKRVYGDDVDLFRPERWLEERDEAKLQAMTRVNDLMFAHGRYACPGKGVALIEISKTVFELLRHFEWGLMNPEKPWKHACPFGLRVITDMWVHVEERIPDSSS